MAVRKVGDRWVVEFQQRGIRVFRRCPPGIGKTDAQALETAIRRDLFTARQLGLRPTVPLAAALQIWLDDTLAGKKDQRMPRQNALKFAPFIEGKRLEDAPAVAAEAIKTWTREGLNPATINRRLAVLKAALKHAWKRGDAEHNLSGRISALPERPGREVFLTAAQVRTLAQTAPDPRYEAGVMLLAYTGMRYGELGIAHVVGDVIRVPNSKTGKSRTIPIATPAKPYAKMLPLKVAHRTFSDWHWEARKKAKMPHVRLHDLRHTAASLLADKGADLHVIGKVLGHTAAATTARYAHLTDKRVREAIRKMR